jgi:hypothetical protein
MTRARIGRRPYWVPSNCRQLREALRDMGVVRISGRPLSRVRKAQLYAVYYRLRETAQGEGGE